MNHTMVSISKLMGVGGALPKKRVMNDDLPKSLGTSDEWIKRRTGIEMRYIAGEDETTISLGTDAARNALAHANMSAEEIDLIIVATATPDNTFPSCATAIQHNLGISHGAAFDIQAVCTGFIYALSVADAMLKAGQARAALVIGSETFSRILDWEERGTCVLFGDGAGAAILKAEQVNETEIQNHQASGVLANYLRSDGQHRDILYVDGGVSTTGDIGKLRMNGREVYKLAVRFGCEVIDKVLDIAGLSANDVDWLVPHQANSRIINAIAEHYGMEKEKVILTVMQHANTSAASVPLALNEGIQSGKIKQGDLILLEAMGGGFTWGASLIRY